MKDEIIKNIIYRLDCKSPTAYDGIELSKEESNLLLDYITNLQEENKRLKEYKKHIKKINEWLNYNTEIGNLYWYDTTPFPELKLSNEKSEVN